MKKKAGTLSIDFDWLLMGIVALVVSIFLVRLGWGSLEPWDEAWYAEIARNVTRGHVLVLKSNGSAYYDHPPLGFWLIAASFYILGESELAARLPMALAGLASVVVVYLVGKELKNKWVGAIAAVVLVSSRWFVLRARTGNLDALLVLMQLLVFYFCVRRRSLKDVYLAWLFLSLSLLTKSVIGLTLLPVVVGASWLFTRDKKVSVKQWWRFGGIFFGPLLIWYGANLWEQGTVVLRRNVWEVGLRKGAAGGLSGEGLKRTFELIHALVHRWFKVMLGAVALGIWWIRDKSIGWVLAYFVLVTLPYLLSSKTMIWHMVPVVAPMALLIAVVLGKMTEVVGQALKFSARSKMWLRVVVLVGVVALAMWVFYEIRWELYRKVDEPSGQKILGEAIQGFPGRLYLDSYENLATSVMFYADRKISYVNTGEKKLDVSMVDRPFSLLTSDEALVDDGCEVMQRYEGVMAVHCN